MRGDGEGEGKGEDAMERGPAGRSERLLRCLPPRSRFNTKTPLNCMAVAHMIPPTIC